MAAKACEVNFDGLVGPTHNYAGLSFGNVASHKHKLTVSRPKDAALQGLAKMKFLADLGLKQGVLPPAPRPDLRTLRRLGFNGSDSQVIEKAYRESPRLLAAVYSASSMWAANAATISPSADTADGRVHFTPANLVTLFHRSLETATTADVMKKIFPDESAFAHHAPLRAPYLDEGAANHTRLCQTYGKPGIEIFAFGGEGSSKGPVKFPARQTRQASEAVARRHDLDPESTVFARQSPGAIDAGAFHNDVVAVGNENVLLYHAQAYAESASVMEEVRQKFSKTSQGVLHLIEAATEQVSLGDAIETYLFNSQLVTLPDGTMSLIAPVECQERANVGGFIEQLLEADNPIRSVHFLDVRQSMKNGGGPACLRLRVVLTEDELSRVHPGVLFTDELYVKLTAWVNRHFRETIRPEDLADPQLATESRQAHEEVMSTLGM